MRPTERSRRPEHRLLLRAAEWNLSGQDGRADVPEGVDWAYFARQARAHSMAAPAYRWLTARPDVEVPGAVASALEGEARAATYEALEMADTLGRVFELLEAEGLRALPFKGPALRARVHDDVAFREAADLDVLVPRAAVRSARSALLEAGFAPETELTDQEFRRRLRCGRHVGVSSESGVRVELHWQPSDEQFPFPFDFDALWADRASVGVGGERLPAMPPGELLLLLAVHGNRHGWEGLCWLCDFAGAVRSLGVEWGALLSTAADRGGERMLLVGVELADRLLGVDPPAALRGRLRDDPVPDLADRVEERFLWDASFGRGARPRYRFDVRERLRDRARMAARVAVLPTQGDLEALPRPVRYYPLAVLAGPFRLAAATGRLLAERVRRLSGP